MSRIDTWSAEEDPKDAVSLAAAGDPRALEAIAKEQLPRVERLLRRLLGDRGDLEDLVQTVFLEMCRALPRFRGESQISTFVGGITVRVARRAMRRSAWDRRRAPMVEETRSQGDDPERRTEARRSLERVRQALAGISPPKRVAFLLWALEGMEPAAIAEMVGASVSAVRSRIFYAQKELRQASERDPALRALLRGDSEDGEGEVDHEAG